MYKFVASVLIMGLLLLVPMVALADAPATASWAASGTSPGVPAGTSVVAFDTWMNALALRYISLVGGYPYSYLAPASADNNGNYILDATEFALITAICNDTDYSPGSLHTQVHEALKRNTTRLATDLGSLAGSLVPPLKYVLAAYATLGDGSYGRDPGDGSIVDAIGSWGIVATTIEAMGDYGSGWAGGAPADANYTRLASLLSCGGDADGDGVNNAHEYYGQSMNRTAYVTAALDDAITDTGTGPGECAGNNTECMVPNVSYTYDAAHGRVYLLTPTAMSWHDAEAYANALTIAGNPFPSHLVSIDSQAENAFCLTLRAMAGDDVWIGASDHAVDAEWRWVATGVEFWYGNWGGTPTVCTGCAIQGGLYNNWNSSYGTPGGTGHEPNGGGGGEDYGVLKSDGTWNDLSESTDDCVTGNCKRGIIEVTGTFPDTDPADGIPDAFTDMLCGPETGPPKPSAAFSADKTSGSKPLTVQFTDASDGQGSTITDWAWTFGDTETSDEASPLHVYDSDGVYTVALTVTTDAGTDTETKTGYITVTLPSYYATIEGGSSWFEEGDDLSLPVTVHDATPPVTYLWLKNGEVFDRPGTDETADTLIMTGLTAGDSGSYTCRVTDSSPDKAITYTDPFVVIVYAAGTLPVAGVVGLVLLAGAAILGARSAMRKK
jgi:PKD repeat protein